MSSNYGPRLNSNYSMPMSRFSGNSTQDSSYSPPMSRAPGGDGTRLRSATAGPYPMTSMGSGGDTGQNVPVAQPLNQSNLQQQIDLSIRAHQAAQRDRDNPLAGQSPNQPITGMSERHRAIRLRPDDATEPKRASKLASRHLCGSHGEVSGG